MWNLILNIALKYAEAHPEQVVNLVHHGVEAGINKLKAHNATNATSTAK